MLRGTYSWHNNSKAPAWLRVMSQSTRDLIRHIEVCTADLASAVCMMAVMGFRMLHQLPKRQRLNLGTALDGGTIWMTFSAACPLAEESEDEPVPDIAVKSLELPSLRKVSSIRLWDCEGNIADSWDVEAREQPTVKKSLELLDEMDNNDSLCSSICTVGTSVLDLCTVGEEVLARGDVAKSTRRRTLIQQQVPDKARDGKRKRISQEIDDYLEELDGLGGLSSEGHVSTEEENGMPSRSRGPWSE